jgi:hypothetical protein
MTSLSPKGAAAPPVLLAYRTARGGLVAWCPHCEREHRHGGDPGHRAAHCASGPYLVTGYILALAA